MSVSNKAVASRNPVLALLGPTNTGKTHYALERMMAHRTGVIGFPLRLLARENYDRVVAHKGAHAVALVTGEEKIIPPKARYFLCTVEAMPIEQEFDFLGIDEVQLCADPERGHVFTDRVLRARGLQETMFMGADTMRPVLSALVPGIQFETRDRLSQLSYKGYKKLARLPKRSAIVAFSLEDVYTIADLIRRQRGGTAVVLGALSPRTRNAQVDMYQSGEVDFMVATDAIGMGLNMDIHHVALASTRKFDGQKPRNLTPAEIAQVAGRAGRYIKDGTFGVTGRQQSLDPETVEAIENHDFKNLQEIYWRNADLEFNSPLGLLRSLERPSGDPVLTRGRPSDDYLTLQALCAQDDIMAMTSGPEQVRLLWDVCQIPDFRKTLSDTHQAMIAEIYRHLMSGPLEEDWTAQQIERLNNVQGDVDTLMARIAHVRTWTYISFRPEWLRNAAHWQERARFIEDRLSDALHEALISRFVDRRAAALMREMPEGQELLAGVRANGEVVVEGHLIGHLQGFSFIPDETAKGAEYKAVIAAARNVLRSEIESRIKTMLDAKPTQFKLADDGRISFQKNPTNPLPGDPIARVRKGQAALSPDIEITESELLTGQDKAAVKDFIAAWLKTHIKEILGPLADLENTDELPGPVRGICFQLYEAMGIVPRENLEDLIASLDPQMRQALRTKQVRLGPILVFLPALNKPAAVRLRGLLWSLWNDKPLPAKLPSDGMVSYKIDPKDIDPRFNQAIGYPVYGPRAIRIDMLDRVINAVYEKAKDGKFKAEHKMAEWLGSSIDDLYAVLEAMGHRKIIEEVKPVEAAPAQPAAEITEKRAEVPSDVLEGQTAFDFGVAPAPQAAPEIKAEAKPDIKPELATFRLKKGKAFEKSRFEKKPFEKPQHGEGKKNFEKKKFDKRGGGKKFDKKFDKKSEGPKIISAVSRVQADSPFAILEQLKVKKDASGS